MDSSQIPSLQHDITISEISADDRRSPNISPNQRLGADSQNFKRKRTALFGHSDPQRKESEHDADLSDSAPNNVQVPFTEERKLEALETFTNNKNGVQALKETLQDKAGEAGKPE